MVLYALVVVPLLLIRGRAMPAWIAVMAIHLSLHRRRNIGRASRARVVSAHDTKEVEQ